jgi:1-pyrroline-5-carboxylate dehydrogenase
MIDIPARIGGRKVRTTKKASATIPHNHRHVLARWHRCGPKGVHRAIQAALDAHKS